MVDKQSSVPNEQDVEFDRAFALLGELVDLRDANEFHPHRANAIYNSCVILWMLIYQRLHPDSSLEAAVKHLIETRTSYLPDNKRVREGRLSLSHCRLQQRAKRTSARSRAVVLQASQRLDRGSVKTAARRSSGLLDRWHHDCVGSRKGTAASVSSGVQSTW